MIFDCGQDASNSSIIIVLARITRDEAVRTLSPCSA
jgi:hypothetical protein